MSAYPELKPAPLHQMPSPILASSSVSRLSLLGSALILASCASMSVDAPSALAQANAAMGGGNVKSLQFEGTGTGGIFGQAYQPGMAWPKVKVSAFNRVMDYEGASLRQDQAISRKDVARIADDVWHDAGILPQEQTFGLTMSLSASVS